MEMISLSGFRGGPVRICIDDNQNGDWQGKLSSPYFGVQPFSGVVDMLALASVFYDCMPVPQTAVKLRSMDGENGFAPRSFPGCGDLLNQPQAVSRKASGRPTGALLTLELTLRSKRNATWQGTIVKTDGEHRVHFESELELIRTVNHWLEKSA